MLQSFSLKLVSALKCYSINNIDEKLLNSEWFREIQFSVDTMQNRGNSVQKEVTPVQIANHGASIQLALVIFVIEVPYYVQLTAVKTRYRLTSIT